MLVFRECTWTSQSLEKPIYMESNPTTWFFFGDFSIAGFSMNQTFDGKNHQTKRDINSKVHPRESKVSETFETVLFLAVHSYKQINSNQTSEKRLHSLKPEKNRWFFKTILFLFWLSAHVPGVKNASLGHRCFAQNLGIFDISAGSNGQVSSDQKPANRDMNHWNPGWFIGILMMSF